MTTIRPHSFGICGGAFGDEGKGRIVDKLVHELSAEGEVVVYRDNGGANAGHTVEFADGQRIALHQLPSGVFVKGAVVVLGKEMVLHPGDLLAELEQVAAVKVETGRAEIKIDELVLLSLDTHRAFESVLKDWQSGGKGSTGRGISPAYADVLLRHPMRMRDVIADDVEKLEAHYDLYAALVKGLGQDLAEVSVPTLTGEPIKVGSRADFVLRVEDQVDKLRHYVTDVRVWLAEKWRDEKCAFVFEKAQAVGLDYRWGVYPDITASDTTFAGIFSASEGVIDPDQLSVRAGVIKATYMSSVGTRKLPTLMKGELADKIRADAHEYGATTKRPRDIAYVDIPALKFFCAVGRFTSLILTHMDIVYSGVPIKVCTEYRRDGRLIAYHPDQEFLDTIEPVYEELAPWDVQQLAAAKTAEELPKEAMAFLKFISKHIGAPIMMITTGPRRDQGLMLEKV
jgi:adenylosuccinate synthase